MVIVGSAIYAEVPNVEIMHLLRDKGKKLEDKQVALFAVCLAKESRKIGDEELGGPVYLKKMERALGRTPMASKIFGGKLLLAEMNEQERKITEVFYEKQGVPFVDIDIVSEKEVNEFVQEIDGENKSYRYTAIGEKSKLMHSSNLLYIHIFWGLSLLNLFL